MVSTVKNVYFRWNPIIPFASAFHAVSFVLLRADRITAITIDNPSHVEKRAKDAREWEIFFNLR